MGVPIEELIKVRVEKLAALKKIGVNVNLPVYSRKDSVASIKTAGKTAAVAGRIRGCRRHGNLCFFDLQDESGQIQVMASAKDVNKTTYAMVKLLDIGDFIGVRGRVFKTKAGEITVKAAAITFLAKALHPLPDSWFGLKDTEERFRARYLDMLMNPQVKAVFDKRWQTEKAIRQYLWSQGYQEVETPVLQNLYGGTNARPFTTHLNALDIDMYLRVAPELYLKRLIVGGYEKIFEIARNFRNEGFDLAHQPEFTMMEFYEAYADYQRIMDVTEGLIKSVAQQVNGTMKLKVDNHQVDLSGKWARITIDTALKKYLDLDWEKTSDAEIKQILQQYNFKVPGVYSKDKALFIIFDHLVTDKLIQPTWVIDYPAAVSPLSKTHRSKPGRVERFEGYIGGKEICDGWSEIVSPIEQRERFETEQKNLKAGDEDAQPLDEEFLEALSYGCPPLGGIGIGIDRLVMFLTNTWSIKEVIPFPLLRPRRK
jgi:lysyl-tRNA synthetase class 2